MGFGGLICQVLKGAYMDIGTLTLGELEDLLRQLNARIEQIHLEARDEQSDRTARIVGAITALDGLLGPDDAPPGVDSIRAVRGYDGQTMSDNAHVALPLAFHGLEILTTVVRDIASTIAHEK